MLVRSAEAADFNRIVQIGQEIHGAITNKSYFNWPAEALAQELLKVQTLVVESDSQIVSFLCYRDLVDDFEISVLATCPRWQKKNFQLTLIKTLQKFAAKQRKSIILEVHAENQKALALYKKMQFELIYTRKHYYADAASALIMSWKLQ